MIVLTIMKLDDNSPTNLKKKKTKSATEKRIALSTKHIKNL